MLGGYDKFGNGATAAKDYTVLPHYEASISFTLYLIDSWDGEYFWFLVNGVTRHTTYYSYTGPQICGKTTWGETIKNVDIPAFSHTNNPLSIYMYANLNSLPDDESFGIKNIVITLELCHTSCAACTGATYAVCSACNSGWYLVGTKCCHSSSTSPYSCATCNGPNNNNCLTCSGSYLHNSQCIATCPTNFYGERSTWTCESCFSGTGPTKRACYECFGPLETSCKSCYTGTVYFANNKSCRDACPDGYYYTSTTYPTNKCYQCYQSSGTGTDGTCVTCSGGASNQCLSCSRLQFLNPSGKCGNTCPNGYYADEITNKCLECYQAPSSTSSLQTCATCGGGTDSDCTSCNSGAFLTIFGTCVLTCSPGWWGDSGSNTCKLCYQYKSTAPTENTCKTCNGGNPNNCLSCNSTTFLNPINKKCVISCPGGYYGDIGTNTCNSCDTTCYTCSGGASTQCTACSTIRYLHNNECLTICPPGYYADGPTNTCKQCYQTAGTSSYKTCATCNGKEYNNCQSCYTGTYLSVSTCITACPAGYYPSTSAPWTCLACVSPCATCTGALNTNCLTCISSQYLLPAHGSVTNTCVSTCPNGWYPRTDTNFCGLCYAPLGEEIERACLTCSGGYNTNCTSCSTGTYFNSLNNTCLNRCPDGYYGDSSTNTCKACYQGEFSCATCSGPLSNQCLSCYESNYFYSSRSTCVDTCPCNGGYFLNTTTNECGMCHSSCAFCSGHRASDCVYSDEVDYNCIAGEFSGKTVVQGIGIAASSMSYITTGLSIATILASGGVSMGAATALSSLGLLGLYQYLNVGYASNVLYFFKYLFSSSYQVFPNIFMIAADPGEKVKYQDSVISGDNKFHLFKTSHLFVMNFGGWLSLQLCVLTIGAASWLVTFFLRKLDAKEAAQSNANGLRSFFQWNLPITIFISSYIQIVLALALQFHFGDFDLGVYEIYSYVVCGLLSLVAVGGLIFFFLYTRFRNLNPISRPLLYNSTKILLNEDRNVRKSPKMKYTNKYWALALCSRNLMLVMFVANLSDYPIEQCAVAIAVNSGFFIANLVWNFFTFKAKRVLVRISEGINACIPIFFLMYGIHDTVSGTGAFLSRTAKDAIGWVIMVLICTQLAVNLVFQVVDGWHALKSAAIVVYQVLKRFLYYITGLDSWYTKPRKQPANLHVQTEMTKLKELETTSPNVPYSPGESIQSLVNVSKRQRISITRHSYLEALALHANNMPDNVVDRNLANDATMIQNETASIIDNSIISVANQNQGLDRSSVRVMNNARSNVKRDGFNRYLEENYGKHFE